MINSFENLIEGFVPQDFELNPMNKLPRRADFLITDVDGDGIAEIIVSLQSNGKRYWVMLNKVDSTWNVAYVKEQTQKEGANWLQLLNTIYVYDDWFYDNHDDLTVDDFIPEDQDEATVMGIVDDKEYAGTLKRVKQTVAKFVNAIKSYITKDDSKDKDYGYDKDHDNSSTIDTTAAEAIFTVVGNVNSNPDDDEVSLTGEHPIADTDNAYTNLAIQVGNENAIPLGDFTQKVGWSPTLNLIDFGNSAYKDIVVTIDNDPSADTISAFIYTFSNGYPRLIFSSDFFNQEFTGSVSYHENYKVVIATSIGNTYHLDISTMPKQTLDRLYLRNGWCRNSRQGYVSKLHDIKFLEYSGSGNYLLVTVQKVIGIYPEDVLGYIESIFSYSTQTSSMVLQSQALYVSK
ncbi:MAG: hypothetical protein BEN18_04110 [Epulopiscium sp. Nuni2H_MBin001]|nr:MAG: hypothetical protein BEN18_04110 [Epulopiscium sp. Nuni2H_MBin001]